MHTYLAIPIYLLSPAIYHTACLQSNVSCHLHLHHKSPLGKAISQVQTDISIGLVSLAISL